jgi:hypothetical protein
MEAREKSEILKPADDPRNIQFSGPAILQASLNIW